jgi:UDP-N-acetylmuramoyl-tripeptide--D-alanyl-D-alanine ligase
MKIELREVAKALGQTIGPEGVATGWSVDSRTIEPGDLFFALRGPNHDGHEHIDEVFRKGAVAVVVDRPVKESSGVVFPVEDSLRALQQLAKMAREKWAGKVIGVTGSAGKTTTKDVIADMLGAQMRTAKTVGNLNNHVGLPLSLLRMDEAAEVAVLEMGMNHAGEIRHLAEIAKPDAGVVTNVGYAHIEAFESVEGIAAAKKELIDALSPEGTAVLNADDPRVKAMGRGRRTILYGVSSGADVRAEDLQESVNGAAFRVGTTQFTTSLSGRHSVSNILAGLAVAQIFGVEREKLVDAVRNLRPGKMRGERFVHGGITVYNDCYNSNPDAVRAMLDVLKETPARRRIAVLGEMLELGRWAEPLHREVGDYAAKQGIDVLVGIRGAAWSLVDAAKFAGHSSGAALFFDDPVQAGRAVRSIAQPGDAILFKGSRGVHVEYALEQFLAPDEGSAN